MLIIWKWFFCVFFASIEEEEEERKVGQTSLMGEWRQSQSRHMRPFRGSRRWRRRTHCEQLKRSKNIARKQPKHIKASAIQRIDLQFSHFHVNFISRTIRKCATNTALNWMLVNVVSQRWFMCLREKGKEKKKKRKKNVIVQKWKIILYINGLFIVVYWSGIEFLFPISGIRVDKMLGIQFERKNSSENCLQNIWFSKCFDCFRIFSPLPWNDSNIFNDNQSDCGKWMGREYDVTTHRRADRWETNI